MRTITPNEVLAGQWTLWKKTANTRIKKLLTQAGETGVLLDMRVVKRSVFEQTYKKEG